MTEVTTLFKRHFAHTPPHVVQAPGCLELIGDHAEQNQGLVLALAVDTYVFIASSPRTDGRIELVSSAFDGKEAFSTSDLSKNPAAPWADDIKGVLLQLRQHGVPLRGFSAAIHGTLPPVADLGGSAALAVAAALTMRRLFPFTLTPTGITVPPKPDANGELPLLTAQEKLEIARACQAAENKFVGAPCGWPGPMASLFGKAFHAIEIDCQSLAVETVPMIGEIAIVVCQTDAKHELATDQYHALRNHCESAVRALGIKSLRAVDPQLLAANRSRLSEREYHCAYHGVGEVQRVIFGARALRDGDFAQFGQYLLQSHESARDFFPSRCAELDLLADLARAHPGCLGSRFIGGGFGGATLNLVRRAQTRDFMKDLAAQYQQRTGHALQPVLCQIVDGAR